MIRKAERKQGRLRINISAPSGGGKTYSSLLLAKGMVGEWEKICVIDTEAGSAELYSHLGAYNVIPLEAPYTPERYIEAIAEAEQAGMEAIIIDSATHEWDGAGGCLEIVESLGGRYQDWGKVTPRHRKLIDKMLSSSAHIITCTRRKQDYDMERSSEGKITVKKLGLKEVQREGWEYEFTIAFDLDIKHLTRASKDRTGQFADKPEFIIDESTGKAIVDWSNSGAEDPREELIKEIRNQLATLGKEEEWLLKQTLKPLRAFQAEGLHGILNQLAGLIEKSKPMPEADTTSPIPVVEPDVYGITKKEEGGAV